MRNRPQRNNNPVNLKWANQKESVGKDEDGFAIFPTAPAGWRAAVAQIKLDQDRGLTLGEFVVKFAPPGENNTAKYLADVGSQVTARHDILLKNISPHALAGVLAVMEGWFAIEKEGWDGKG